MGEVSAERRMFDRFLRTGRRSPFRPIAAGEQIEWKFNPYHDPRSGQFTFGPYGAQAHGSDGRIGGKPVSAKPRAPVERRHDQGQRKPGKPSARTPADSPRPRDAQRPAGTWNPKTAYERAVRVSSEELARTKRMAPEGGHNDIYDAERHARWAYRMAVEVGPGWAQSSGVGHEYANLRRGEPLGEYRMDIHDNNVGLNAALTGKSILDRLTPGLMYIRADGKRRYQR